MRSRCACPDQDAPGYRVYFGIDGTELVVLLLCGDKRTQHDDIGFAKVLWTEYRARKRLPSTKPATPTPEPILKPKE